MKKRGLLAALKVLLSGAEGRPAIKSSLRRKRTAGWMLMQWPSAERKVMTQERKSKCRSSIFRKWEKMEARA